MSYGADPDVDALVRRLNNETIEIPNFQRGYVWNQAEASKFIESLLLGLPVPGIFFANDRKSGKQLVIDGQQRLRSLQFFYNGYFNPKADAKTQRVFNLIKVQEHFEGKTYQTLDESDRLRLDTSIIHATIVQQIQPSNDDTSMYHIFARLNAGGRRLADQEIRTALYHGPLIDMLGTANNLTEWREVYGKKSARLKDQELILRFFALYDDWNRYIAPMSEFLNTFSNRYKESDAEYLNKKRSVFERTIKMFYNSVGSRPFRLRTAMNAAVFDSCMVGLASRLETSEPSNAEVLNAYNLLLKDKEFLDATSRATARPDLVKSRITKCIDAFRG